MKGHKKRTFQEGENQWIAQTVEQGSNSDVFGCFDGIEWFVLFVFVVMSVTGIILAVTELIHKE